MRTFYFKLSAVFILIIFLAGCTSSKNQLLAASKSQVELRSFQTRAFDSADQIKMLRTIMSTLQDLDFVIDRADAGLGTVTASKFTSNQLLKMTVTVRPRGQSQLLVRASAQFGIQAIEDPEPYRDFFTALEQSLFLTAHEVE